MLKQLQKYKVSKEINTNIEVSDDDDSDLVKNWIDHSSILGRR